MDYGWYIGMGGGGGGGGVGGGGGRGGGEGYRMHERAVEVLNSSGSSLQIEERKNQS